MTPKKQKLKLVTPHASQYPGADVLGFGDATVVSSPQQIGAALGLYFQWEKKRSCHVILSKRPSERAIECTMDYDRDEANPTEIRVHLASDKSVSIVPGAEITIMFDVFKVGYNFSTIVTATSSNPEAEGWHVITEVPTELKVIRTRRLPRFGLTNETRKKLPAASWSSEKSQDITLKLIEIGLGSARAEYTSKNELSDKSGTFKFGELEIPAQVVRSSKNEIVYTFELSDSETFGAFFDYYRAVAYPTLRSRYEIPFKEGIDLYERANYFGLFNSEKSEKEKQEIMQTWEDIRSGFHKTNADYYVTNSSGEPTGCSGIALANFSGEKPVWDFHQLCALKNPDLIDQSGILYTWRAEYLAAQKEDLIAVGSFRSKSRWLERIYVKHVTNSNFGSKLSAVVFLRCLIDKTIETSGISLKTYPVGETGRVSSTTKRFWASANPKFLNANGNLDTIVAIFEPLEWQEIQSIGSDLRSALELESISLLIAVPHDYNLKKAKGEIYSSDRMVQIPKSDLFSFISSVEHSLAITERKLLNGNHE